MKNLRVFILIASVVVATAGIVACSDIASETSGVDGTPIARTSADSDVITGATWTGRDTGLENRADFVAVRYARGLWVAGSRGGEIITSTNGTEWTPRHDGTNAIRAIGYGNGLWVAVGANGSITTSSNGTTWAELSTSVTEQLWDVEYAHNLWVTVGHNGVIYTSTDGADWAQQRSDVTDTLLAVHHANALWVATGGGDHAGNPVTTISKNGTAWSIRPGGGGEDIHNANGRWVIANRDGIITSAEGIEWEPARSSVDGGAIGARSVTYANGLWVAGNNYSIATSTDGVTWTPVDSTVSGRVIGYANSLWVAAGFGGTIYTSNNGTAWTAATLSGTAGFRFRDVEYANGLWVVVGQQPRNGYAIFTSGIFPPSVNEDGLRQRLYTCTYGVPRQGVTTNPYTENCTTCRVGYTLSANTCVVGTPFICDNGTPVRGTYIIPNTQYCERCDAGYTLITNKRGQFGKCVAAKK